VPNHKHLLRQKKKTKPWSVLAEEIHTPIVIMHTARATPMHRWASVHMAHAYPAGPLAVLRGDLSKINAQTYRETDSQLTKNKTKKYHC
jgi:hypothetical protein